MQKQEQNCAIEQEKENLFINIKINVIELFLYWLAEDT